MATNSSPISRALSQLLGHPGRRVARSLIAIALSAIIVPAAIVADRAAHPALPARVTQQMPVVPKAALPPVDPVAFASVSPEKARAFNATIPFSTGPNPAARPFRLTDEALDQARAVDCLATAVLFEAGDDTEGQSAVAQVILNRLRHPAFPKSVCGVVFQGSERRTGCQFTFTCDGALQRHQWSEAAWTRAREVAQRALNGRVYAPVGYATHYHTDWVVPYWSSSLDKVQAVGSHLFFRWTGWWGTPPAFNRRVTSSEPIIKQLAGLSLAHGAALNPETQLLEDMPPEAYVAPKPLASDENSFLATIDWRTPPEHFRTLAEASCGVRAYCKYMAWTAKVRTPTSLPLDAAQIAAMSFSYFRDRGHGFEKALWNCGQFLRPDPTQCMKIQTFQPPAAPAQADRPGIKDAPGPGNVSPVPKPAAKPDPTPLSAKSKEAGAAPISRATPLPIATPTPAP